MCQLLGLNSNLPTDICFSFTGFRARGGETDKHADGWGIAFFEEGGVRVLHDPQPACSSRLAALVADHPLHATTIIAHIRKATVGAIRLENTHPFSRELWGRQWVFAHNGTLLDFSPALEGRFRPAGTTDSELAFCWLMEGLLRHFGDTPPERLALFEWLQGAAVALTRFGVINFLLSDGERLFAHCSTRLSHVMRQAPFGDVHLVDADLSVDLGSSLDPATRSVIVATVPLTSNENWVAMPAGSLWCFQAGELVAMAPTRAGQVPVTTQDCV